MDLEELRELGAGRGTDEMRARLCQELVDPESPLCQFIRGSADAMARLVGWGDQPPPSRSTPYDRATDEQRRWEGYLNWVFGMVRFLVEQGDVEPAERLRLVDLLEGLHAQLGSGRGPRFSDAADLWRCILDIVMLEHRRGAETARAPEPGTAETEEDWKVEDYQATPEFAQRVSAHFRRCIGLLGGWESPLRELAVGKLKGHSEEELGDKLGRTIQYVHSGLRIIRHRWKAMPEPAQETAS